MAAAYKRHVQSQKPCSFASDDIQAGNEAAVSLQHSLDINLSMSHTDNNSYVDR